MKREGKKIHVMYMYMCTGSPARDVHDMYVVLYTAKNVIPIRGRKRAQYGMELQYRYVHLGQSHCIFCMGSALQLESTCNPSVCSRP